MLGDPRIPAEIRGKYRTWRSSVQRQAERITAVFDSRQSGFASGDFRMRKGKGKARALAHLRRIYENAGARYLDSTEDGVRWAFLEPRGDEIIAMIITFDRDNGGLHSWLMAFTNHALQRALQRSAPGLDLAKLVWEGVENARRLSVPALLSMTPDRISIAAGAGAFASEVEMIELAGNEMPLVRARTWIARDSMSAAAEMRIVPEGEPGSRLDDAYRVLREKWSLPPRLLSREFAPQR